MSEFQLQIIVDSLLHQLGSKTQPEEILDYLQKNINSTALQGCSNTQLIGRGEIDNLASKLPKSDPFIAKYNDLKQKNVDSLDIFVQLLSHISHDSGVKEMLGKTKKQLYANTEPNITKDNLPEVINNLKEKIKMSPGVGNRSSIFNTSENAAPTSRITSTPSVISWVQRKPSMSMDFSTTNFGTFNSVVPEISQENMLIEDLLNILMGLTGCYIEPEELKDPYGPRTFRINDQIPLSLQELVKQILPLASHYSIIQRFTEEKMRFEFGQVNNALAEAMQSLIKDHMLFIVQLETEARCGNMNLQQMWFYSQRNMQCLGIAADIAFSISKSDAKGGKVLSLLHDNVISSIGDERNHQLCLKLMEEACIPYMKMLGMWIYRGIISDPISEFLVEDNERIPKEAMPVDYSADYWAKKYLIKRERIPKFLESVSDIILKTGKYINVIRQCGKPVKHNLQPIEYKIEEKHYIESIEKAYLLASQNLLDLVLKEHNLIARLKSVKHYFLLDQGDFIVTFMSLCEKELNKSVVDVIQARLESLMDLALRLSSAVNDPYKDDLKTELIQWDLQQQMCKILNIQTNLEKPSTETPSEPKEILVIESFVFNYNVRWPLSLILNKATLAIYQMLFRHLFYSKYVERLLCQVWKSNKVAKKFHCDDAKHYRNAFVLRQKMLHCVQNLEYHMMVEVIEPHWTQFLQKIYKVQNVDEILTCHSDFLDSCMKDCMLTIPDILNTVVNILNICVEFSKFMQQMQRYFVEAELGSLPNSLYDSFTQNETLLQPSLNPSPLNMSFKDNILNFESRFFKAIRTLLSQINGLSRDSSEHDRLFNLLYRLDFNSFYTSGRSTANTSG